MRTRFEIVLCGDRGAGTLRAAGEEALDEIARVESELSAFRPDSALARINAEAGDHPVAVDGQMWNFLVRAGRLCELTKGAFDPSVGAVSLRAGRRASRGILIGWQQLVRLDKRRRTVAFAASGVRLDPGAVGKGYAIERAVEVLQGCGIRNALVHGGTSSVYGMGAPPGNTGWKVAVSDPTVENRRVAYVLLKDRALGVSAPRLGHVLDPHSGKAVQRTLLAAVVTESAAEADALSTALLVLQARPGKKGGAAPLAMAFPGASFLCVERKAGRGKNFHVESTGGDFLFPVE